MAQQIWLSKDYVEKTLSENIITDGIIGTIDANIWFGNSFGIEDKIQQLIIERGYADGEINYGVSWAYAASDIDPAIIAITVLVLTLILLSGYLIIYSIFVISINADIHFFGLLKTIGTIGRQIRKIVRGQALILSALGIPIGLLCGYFSGVSLTPLMFNFFPAFSGGGTNANPLVFVFAVAFSLLTVFIGCRKPAKIAATVSPVEAVKYSGVTESGKRKAKKTRKVTALSMAWANVTREKRKFGVTVLSLSLALILLNSAFSATKSFDMDAYLSGSIISDFSVAHYTVFSNTVNYTITDGITDDFLGEAAAHGAEEMSSVYYHYSFESHSEDDMPVEQVYGVGKMELARFSDVDYEKLRSGNYAIVSRAVLDYGGAVIKIPEIGDILTFIDEKNNGTVREFEVIGLTDEYPYQLSARYYLANSLQAIIADERFFDFYGVQPMQTNINVSSEKISEFESWLESYTSEQDPDLDYISRNTLKAEFDGLATTYLVLGSSLSFILALVGALNFVNAIAASVIARRRELAMLQSVGMTGKQLRLTLFFEGGWHAVLSMCFTLTIGLALGFLILQVIAQTAWFFKQSFTVMPSVICAIPLFVICAVCPLVCYKRLTRESLVERLRVE